MLEWINKALNFSWLAPFPYFVGFVISVIGAVLSAFISDLPGYWPAGLCSLAIMFAIWAFAVSQIGPVAGFASGIAGFATSMLCWYLMIGFETNLNMLRQNFNGCVMIDKRDVSECIDAAIRRVGS